MKAKKLLSLSLAAVLAMGTLAGCGEKKSDKIQISVGGWPAKEGQALDDKVAQKAGYEAMYPGVEIVPDTWAFDLNTFYPKANSGKLPTVYNTHYTEVEKIVSAGYAADLTEKMKADGFENLLNPNVAPIITSDGKIYAYPISAHINGLAYNVRLFEAAGLMNEDGTPKQPKDWNEVVEFAKLIKEKTGMAGFMFPTAKNQGGWRFTMFAWSFGADFMEQDADGKWIATMNTPECEAALQFVKDLKWVHDVLPSNTLIDDQEYFKLFSTGQVGMMFGADDTPANTVKYEMPLDDLGLMPMPAGPARRVTMLGGGLFFVSDKADADQINAAVDWIKYTGFTPKMDEAAKENREKLYQQYVSEGRLVGIRQLSPWSEDSEFNQFEKEMNAKYLNANINHFKAFNDSILDLEAAGIEIQTEEPVCCQDLYTVLDNCVQEVLNNKDADVKQLLENANADFQTNYLDNMAY